MYIHFFITIYSHNYLSKIKILLLLRRLRGRRAMFNGKLVLRG